MKYSSAQTTQGVREAFGLIRRPRRIGIFRWLLRKSMLSALDKKRRQFYTCNGTLGVKESFTWSKDRIRPLRTQ